MKFIIKYLQQGVVDGLIKGMRISFSSAAI